MTISELADETGHSESYIVKQMQEAGMLRAKKSKDVSDQTINSSYEDELEDRGGDIYWDGRSSIDEEIRGMVNVINRDDDDEDDEFNEIDDDNDEEDEEEDDDDEENDVNDNGRWNEVLTSFFEEEGHTDVFIEKASNTDSWKMIPVEHPLFGNQIMSSIDRLKGDIDGIRADAYSLMSDDEIKEDLQSCFPSASEEAIEYMAENEALDDFNPVRRLLEIYDEAKEKANNHFSDKSLVQWYVEKCLAKDTVLDFNDELEAYFENYGPWQKIELGGYDSREYSLEELLDEYYEWDCPAVTYDDPFLKFGDCVFYSKFLDDQMEDAKMPDDAPAPEDEDDED